MRDLEKLGVRYRRTGSSVIPGVENPQDEDYVVYVKDFELGEKWISERGYTQPKDVKYPEHYSSWRKGRNNVIRTASEDFFKRFCAATSLAIKYKLTEKADRIELFQAVLYGTDLGVPVPS